MSALGINLVSGEGITVADRRDSVWNDPRLWVSICGVLLTLVLFTVGFVAAQLSSIKDSVQSSRDAITVVTTRQATENEALRDRVSKLENFMTIQQQAYNYNVTTRLAVVEAKNGIKPPSKE